MVRDRVARVDAESALKALKAAADAVRASTLELEDWGSPGGRPGQCAVDLVADAAAVPVLLAAGFAVLSEESGTSGATPTSSVEGLLAVLDPIDGTTNATRGLRPYSTSICLLDQEGPWVGLVADHASGMAYEAIRGAGASRDGRSITASRCRRLDEAIVAISGFPPRSLGWSQFRAFGAASLELCCVAEGSLDAFARAGDSWLYPWDYLAGLLICQEAGAVFTDLKGEELVVRDGVPRAPAAAATPELLDQLVASLS